MIKKTSTDQPNSALETQEDTNSTTTYSVNETSVPSTRMSWLGPIIGIVLVLAIAGSSYAGYNYIKDTLLHSGIADMAASRSESNNSTDEYITEFRGEVPSSCGYSMSIPDTINVDEGYQQWFYEEVPLTAEAFYGFGPASSQKSNVLMATMFFKTKEEKFDLKSTEGYSFKWPGLVSYCVNNTENWDLEQFTQSAVDSSNDQQAITTHDQPIAWGEIMVQELNMTGISNGQYVNQPFYIAIIPAESEHSRLVIFQPWGSEDSRLSTDQESLIYSLKNRELTEDLKVGTSTPATGSNSQTQTSGTTQSSCTDYNIREGVFASNKCYIPKDLADLQYYLKRYNSAVFDQNAAVSGMKVTCNGSEFFKNECEEDKSQYDQAIKDIEQYKGTIEGIIAKGK